QAPELQNEAALADALLHPQDRAYSVPEFLDLIKNSQLVFGRWLRQAAYSVHCGVVQRLPQGAKIACLPPEERYAAIELFRGTMIRHSAILYHNECSSGLHSVCFSNDDCLSYVPVRMSDSICIEDRAPEGAAAVLINRGHTYKDLVLAIDSKEKNLFGAIDGRSKIGEIALRTSQSKSRETDFAAARSFFERLWWHDHAVFDTGTKATNGRDFSHTFVKSRQLYRRQ